MSEDAVTFYRRLFDNDEWLRVAMCFTYAQSVDEDQMIEAFGGDPATAAPMTLDEHRREMDYLYDYRTMPPAVLVRRFGGWVVGVEENGFRGSLPGVLRPLSAGGPALSVFWNVNSDNRWAYAVQGHEAVVFDMYASDQRMGTDPHLLDGYMSGLPFGEAHEREVAGMALAERITGVRLTRDALLRRKFRRAILKREDTLRLGT